VRHAIAFSSPLIAAIALVVLTAMTVVSPRPVAAATLETAAQVVLIPPAEASLTSLDQDGSTSWQFTGAPDERLQLSVELRDAGGHLLRTLAAGVLTLDGDGQTAATLAGAELAAPASPHAPLPVTTLVICRE